MQVTIKANFNKQTKDSKKQLVQFYVKGDDEHLPELNMMCREVVELRIGSIDSLTAEFVKKSQDSKKTVLDFVVNGGASNNHAFEFYKLAGTDVELTITESQMDIDEFREQQEAYREGVRGKIDKDGTVTVDEDQMTLEEATAAADQSGDPMAGVGDGLPFTSLEEEGDDLE
ncbi:hypothetical protein KP806_07305 [Paenibacillus sp. N4]|uniref:hypothetical protein n=1 Tax=Paenibacillus vietnamensis TaxID=2590547 RepID=UPI001CD0B8D7|nr:hypothetical protein [Paenibacillus vietnamensis]MCA0754853.1 hypothetical protein [Paenibacillus vietnamensis]